MSSHSDRSAEARTSAPGICLVVVGILNMVLAVFVLREGLNIQRMTLPQFQQTLQDNPLWGVTTGNKKAAPTEEHKSASALGYIGLAVLNFLGALLTIYGGINMRSLSHYGLAVVGSVWALVPFLSLSACCGIGEIVGVWALVVLLSQEVRSAFQ